MLYLCMNRLVKKLEKIGRDPKITAKAVGLRYVSDSTPGYTRKKAGKGWSFYDAGGALVKDKELVTRFTKLVIPPMQAQKEGVIIYLASIAGVRGNRYLGLYGISKAGLIELARNLAVEFGPDNIRVNTISPGMINTPFSASLMKNDDFMKKRLAQTPLRKVGEVEEIAGVAVMLASKAGGFITGQNIIVDGGTTISDGN